MAVTDTNPGAAPQERRGVPNYVMEAIMAALVLVLGITVLAGSWHLGSGWTSDGPGAGYFPFYVGLILCIAGAGIFYQCVIKRRDTELFVDSEQIKRVLVVLVPGLVYVLVVQFLGLYVGSAIYIAAFMIGIGKYSPVKSVIAAVIVSGLLLAMFEIWFKVPLFKGSLDPLGFLGY